MENKIKELEEKLLRKEQECKALREEKAYTDMACEQFEQQLDQLKAENEELKDLNTRLDNQREAYWKEYQKLKQTLAEIKEIANRPYLLPCGGDCKQQNCTDKTTEKGKHCMELKLIQILQICDEVNDVK